MSGEEKLDTILQLLDSSLKNKHRSLFVIVGGKSRHTVVQLHNRLNLKKKNERSVLWCYSKDLGFNTHPEVRKKELKKLSLRSFETEYAKQEFAFDHFSLTNKIRYTKFKQSEQILGTSFGMCVIQDFLEAPPNVICHALEAVEGGGICVVMLNSISSLDELAKIYRGVGTPEGLEISKFHYRLLWSFKNMPECIVMDETQKILILNEKQKIENDFVDPTKIKAKVEKKEEKKSAVDVSNSMLLEMLNESENLNLKPIFSLCDTNDQLNALESLVAPLAHRRNNGTCIVTGPRGRGKSASLGLSIACALILGVNKIALVSPCIDNVRTVFDFIRKGLISVNMMHHVCYEYTHSFETISSTIPGKDTTDDDNSKKEFAEIDFQAQRMVFTMNGHRQVLEYFSADEDKKLISSSDLVVIDEAAAIPLPIVKGLLGKGLIFLSSTIHGYEGTGRSLSTKLFQDVENNKMLTNNNTVPPVKIQLEAPIRYAANDPVEKWLYEVFCLDANKSVYSKPKAYPPVEECVLHEIDRAKLFSGTDIANKFLQSLMSLFIASHYRNSPNDMMILANTSSHRLFALYHKDDNKMVNPITLLEIAYEGGLVRDTILDDINKGKKTSDDILSWSIAQSFSDATFTQYNGVRVVRVATHPGMQGRGYGKAMISQFIGAIEKNTVKDSCTSVLHTAGLIKKINSSSFPAPLDFMGVLSDTTQFGFWKKAANMRPIKMDITKDSINFTHPVLMIRSLTSKETNRSDTIKLIIDSFHSDYRYRMIELLPGPFKKLPCLLAMSLLGIPTANSLNSDGDEIKMLSSADVRQYFTESDIVRLRQYSNQRAELNFIMDLLPIIAKLYFQGVLDLKAKAEVIPSTILLGVGLQRMQTESLFKELKLDAPILLSKFNQFFSVVCNHLESLMKISPNNENKKRKL